MYRIKYSKLAEIELDSIFSYIDLDNNFYAVKVIKKIYDTIQNLINFPYLGGTLGGLRKFVDTKYKFNIVYEIDENKEVINIISVYKYKNNL